MFAVPSIAPESSNAAQLEKPVTAEDRAGVEAPLHSVAGIVPTLQ